MEIRARPQQVYFFISKIALAQKPGKGSCYGDNHFSMHISRSDTYRLSDQQSWTAGENTGIGGVQD